VHRLAADLEPVGYLDHQDAVQNRSHCLIALSDHAELHQQVWSQRHPSAGTM
jgi:hypothetical protein